MSRPLTGSRRQVGNAWEVTVPKFKGASGPGSRAHERFATEEEAIVWQNAAVAALNAGHPLPSVATETATAAPAVSAPVVWSLGEAADEWFEHHYVLMHGARGDRMRDVTSVLNKWVKPYFASITDVRVITLRHGRAFARHLAGFDGTVDGTLARNVEGLPILSMAPDTTLSLRTASRLASLSLPELESAMVAVGQSVADSYTPAQLADAGLVDLATPRGLARKTAQGALAVLHGIMQHAEDENAIDKVPWTLAGKKTRGSLRTIQPAPSRRLRPPGLKAVPVRLSDARKIAAHLDWVDQLSFWILRLMGLRLGELFGLRVRDIERVPGGAFVRVSRQGGRTFLERDDDGDDLTIVTEVDHLKTEWSLRPIPIPSALLRLIDLVIATCHTDPATGEVDLDARLIPGLRTADLAGQQTFRAGLARASQQALGRVVVPKLLRASLATQMKVLGVDPVAARRVLGHLPGIDVHDVHYVLDDPDLRLLNEAIAAIDRAIDEELGGDLLTPTSVLPNFSAGSPFYARHAQICEAFADAGWDVTGGGEDPLLTAAQAAPLLNLQAKTIRRLFTAGKLPFEVGQRWGKDVRLVRESAVAAYLDSVANSNVLVDISEDFGVAYHSVRVLALRLHPGLQLHPATRRLLINAEQEAAIRTELARVRDLHLRSVPSADAAKALDRPRQFVATMLAKGELVRDPETDTSKAVFVTRDSLTELLAKRSTRRRPAAAEGQMLVAEFCEATGLDARQVAQLCVHGQLEMVVTRGARALSRASVRRWATGFRPDLLDRL